MPARLMGEDRSRSVSGSERVVGNSACRSARLPGPASHAYISRIEAGARQPSVRALRKLAAKLNVSVEWLETGEDRHAEALRDPEQGLCELRSAVSTRPSQRRAWMKIADAMARLGQPLPWRRTKRQASKRGAGS